jgi:poly-beta-1,6-N-acetyl-D-glucosamine synthase
MFPKSIAQSSIKLPVSIIIAAYKEAKVIGTKLQNTLALNYPLDALEIIVVSDGNEDNTVQIVESFKHRGVISSHSRERKGKMAAINRGIEQAKGEIVLLSDANSMYSPDVLMKIVRNFTDPAVGGVSGRKSIFLESERASSEGDSAYWKYESFLKTCQSKIGSITTGDGEIFAFRKSLFKPVSEKIINDDMAITIDIIEQGYRVIYEPEAISGEFASIQLSDDFWVKVRMVTGGFQSMQIYLKRLLCFRPFFAFQFLSHKALRWTAPIFLIGAYISSIALLTQPLFMHLVIAQSLFYGFAVLAIWIDKQNRFYRFLYYPYYFCLMNAAALLGLAKFLKSETDAGVLWKRAQR